MRFVVPDCRQPDEHHDPPGTRPAAYSYEWRDDQWNPGWIFSWVLCVECCARVRMLSQQPDPPSFAPPATRIRPLRDANTQERVI